MTLGLALIAGAAAGSAAGAALHRWPTGATLLRPRRSACSSCGTTLRARDLVPLLSWLVLKGRCRGCGVRIDPRLPVLEGSAALIAALVVAAHGPGPAALVIGVGAVAVLVAAMIDLEHRIVPDRLTIPLGLLALLALPTVAGADRAPTVAAWALGVPLALHLLVVLADASGRARPIGGGDVKLLVGVLALAGSSPLGPPAVLIVAVVLAGTVASVGLLCGLLRRGSRLPFAPALAVPSLVIAVAPDRALDILMVLGGPTWHA